jgi:hypothetical protein
MGRIQGRSATLLTEVTDVDGSSAAKGIIMYGDVDGNTTANFEIGLVGVTSIAATDFVL